MFWKFNQLPVQIDTVLLKEGTTLGDILDQENVLQELKSQNKKLLDFITRADIIYQLVGLVIDEPSLGLEEHEKYRRPNIACEVLTTDIPFVNERLTDKTVLTKLYSFLEQDPPLNPLLASFFSRTMTILICRKADQNWYSYQYTCLQFLNFLKDRENSLNLLLKHLDTSAIMDFTLKLLTQVEGHDVQTALFNWMLGEGLIENIFGLFDSKIDEGRHYNAAQLLCDTIRKCREIRELDPILTHVQSTENIKYLLDLILKGDHVESCIVGGLSVLLTLLEPPPGEQNSRRGGYYENSGSGEPPPSNPAVYRIVSAIIPYLPTLHDLLLNPPKKAPVKLPCGTIELPLGNTRLTVIKLIAALIATNTPEINEELDRLNTVQVLLDLFFHYTWNNFLHSQVDKCLAFALNYSGHESTKNPLIYSIFIKCRLLQRILEAWEENETEQYITGGKRRGYMGHLTNIANSVIKQGDCLEDFINENVDENTRLSWTNYVQTILNPINELHEKVLGGGPHPAQNTNKNEILDYHDASFPGDQPLNQNFNDFPNPAGMNSDFIESYAFDLSREMNNSLEDSNKDKRAELFKEMCQHNFDDLGTSMEEWKNSFAYNNSDDFSSSSDEENDKKPLEKSELNLMVPVIDQVNPWSVDGETNESNEVDDWADFTSFDGQFPLSAGNSESLPETEDLLQFRGNSSVSELFPDREKESFSVDSVTNSTNVNSNDLVLEDIVPEDELIENFRFLAIQRLVSDKNGCSSKSSEEVNVVNQEEQKPVEKGIATTNTAHEPEPV